MEPVRLVIYGQAASKSNRRQLVTIGDLPRLIKSPEARAFVASALRQIPPRCRVRMSGDVRVTLHVHYASRRPDLDEQLVLDVLQDQWATVPGHSTRVLVQAGLYKNDRQVAEKHVYRHVDPAAPRVEVLVESLEPQGLLPGL